MAVKRILRDRFVFVTLSFRKAWSATWPPRGKRWESFIKPVAAAAMSAIAVVAHLTQGAWERQVGQALVVGLGAVVIYLCITFLFNLLWAPRAIRKEMVDQPGRHGATLRITAWVKDLDVMQQEAAGIVAEIDAYLERRKRPGLVEQPSERKRIEDKIELFGSRASADKWITEKSRRRSLKLHTEISASGDLQVIEQRCRAFLNQRASH